VACNDYARAVAIARARARDGCRFCHSRDSALPPRARRVFQTLRMHARRSPGVSSVIDGKLNSLMIHVRERGVPSVAISYRCARLYRPPPRARRFSSDRHFPRGFRDQKSDCANPAFKAARARFDFYFPRQGFRCVTRDRSRPGRSTRACSISKKRLGRINR